MSSLSDWQDAAPLVIAHRGASYRAPENTLPAFELAVRLGADAVELDAKLSRDGRVVAFHDQTLERTTGERGRPGARTAAELRRLDAGQWMGPSFRGTGVPEVRDVLDLVARNLLVNIELTDYAADQGSLAEQVVALVREMRVQARVLISSFDSSALNRVKRIAPEIPIAHLFGPTWLSVRDLVRRRAAQALASHLHVSLVRRRSVAAAQWAGRRLHVYTVDEPETIARLRSWGVDGVITNAPDLARRAWESMDG